jgi:transposase
MDEATNKPHRKRREFTAAFKAAAVGQVIQDGRCAADVARELDLAHSVLRRWVRKELAEQVTPGQRARTEKEEIARLRKENRELRLECNILRRAAVLLANPSR